jgi:hypothetical protein
MEVKTPESQRKTSMRSACERARWVFFLSSAKDKLDDFLRGIEDALAGDGREASLRLHGAGLSQCVPPPLCS